MEIKLFTQEQIEKIGKSYINITKATLTQAKYRFSLYNRNCFVTLEEFYERVIELTDHVMMKCIEYDDYYRVFALPSNSPVEININNIFQKKSNVDKNRLKTCLTNLHELLKDSFNKDLFCLLYCHYFLVQNESKWNIDNSNRPYSFNLSEKKQIMKHVIEYLMHTPLDPKMIEYIDSYFNIYGTIESNLDIIISKNNKYEDFYDTLESISTIKFWNLLVINFGFYRYYIKIYTQLDSIQNSNSYNIFLDAILKPLYTNAIYQLLRDYNPDTISYSSFLKNHINELEDIPQDVVRNDLFTEATRILSNRFSQSVTKHDVNGTYTFFSKSSTSNFDKHPSFNPLRVDSNYLDLIFLSIKNKNTSPPSELSEYNENETANDMGNRIKENIFHKIFPHARQDTQDIRSENIRDYNFLLRNHKLNSDKLPKYFIETINACIKYITPTDTLSPFQILNFNYNPFVYEWAYLKYCVENFKNKDNEHNNFLLELKKIPFYEIRKSLLDNYSLFFKLYKDDPSIIEKYSQISTIVNRIIMMIIKDLLNLPDTAVDDTFDKMYSDLSNQLLNNCHIDCIPTEMSTSKTKTLQAIVKLETKLLT